VQALVALDGPRKVGHDKEAVDRAFPTCPASNIAQRGQAADAAGRSDICFQMNSGTPPLYATGIGCGVRCARRVCHGGSIARAVSARVVDIFPSFFMAGPAAPSLRPQPIQLRAVRWKVGWPPQGRPWREASLFVMARFMRAIHTVRGLWMARTSRAMTVPWDSLRTLTRGFLGSNRPKALADLR
jgi:hypothetical protein